jgi:pilus assembly protein Flp/PilA
MLMRSFIQSCLNFLSDEEGATAVEYGLIIALVGAAITVAVSNLGSGLTLVFTNIANKITLAAA